MQRPASVSPIEVEVEAGPRSDQFAWDYRDKTDGSGGGCGGTSEDEAVLSADDRERAGSVTVGLVGGAGISGMILDQWYTRVLEWDVRPTASI